MMRCCLTLSRLKVLTFGIIAAPGPGTRQLAELNYGVCVQMLPGYCSIEWTQSVGDKYSFTVSGDTEALDPTVLGKYTCFMVY